MSAGIRRVSKLALEAVLLIAALTAPAFAIPGQTTAQLAAWGKGNAALRGFKPTIDDSTGGTNYMAIVNVDGLRAEFNAEPQRGRVHMEYISFQNVSDAWFLEQHMAVAIDAIRKIYGDDYAADFKSAQRVPHAGRVAAWQGKKLGYATFGTALFIADPPEFANVLENMHVCDAIACGDVD
jgi:hypothetical protein